MEKVYFFIVWIAVFDPSGQIYVPGGYQKPVTYTPEIEVSEYQRPTLHHNYSRVYHQNGHSRYTGTKTTQDLHPVYKPQETYVLNGTKIGRNSNPTRQIVLYNKEKRTPKVQIYRDCPEGATGQFVYDASCHQFLNCWKGRGHVQNCSPGTLFNPKTLECDYPQKVYCISGPRETVLQEQRSFRGFKQVGCPKDFSGLIPNYTDCSKFLNCVSGIENVMDCPSGTLFDVNKNICDFAHKATCFNGENQDLIENNVDGKLDFQQKHQTHQQLRYKSEVKCPLGVMGLHPHPTDCTKFLNCGDGRTHVQECGPGTLFNPSVKICDFPYNVRCQNSTSYDYDTRNESEYDQGSGYKSIDSYRGHVYQYPQNQFAHNGVTYSTPTSSRTPYSSYDQNQYHRGSTNLGGTKSHVYGSRHNGNEFSGSGQTYGQGTQIYGHGAGSSYDRGSTGSYAPGLSNSNSYGQGSQTYDTSSSSSYDRNHNRGSTGYGTPTYDHSSGSRYDTNYHKGSTSHGSGGVYGTSNSFDPSSGSTYDRNHNRGTIGEDFSGSYDHSSGSTLNRGTSHGTNIYGTSGSYDHSSGNTLNRGTSHGTNIYGTSGSYDQSSGSTLNRGTSHGTNIYGTSGSYDHSLKGSSNRESSQGTSMYGSSGSYDHSSDSTLNRGTSHGTNIYGTSGSYDHSSSGSSNRGSIYGSSGSYDQSLDRGTQGYGSSGSYDRGTGSTFDNNQNQGSQIYGSGSYGHGTSGSFDNQNQGSSHGSSGSYGHGTSSTFDTNRNRGTQVYGSSGSYDQGSSHGTQTYGTSGTFGHSSNTHGTNTYGGYDQTFQGPYNTATTPRTPIYSSARPYDQNQYSSGTVVPVYDQEGNRRTGSQYGHTQSQGTGFDSYGQNREPLGPYGSQSHSVTTKTYHDSNTPNYDQVVNINHVHRTTQIPFRDKILPSVSISVPTDYDDNYPNQGNKHIRSTTSKIEKSWPPPFPSTDVNADYVFEYDDNEGVTLEAENVISDSNCKRGDFACTETCVPKSLLCNGVKDCQDGKDEHNCLESLAKFSIQKNKKLAILEKQRWDNVSIAGCASLCVDNQKVRCRAFNYRKIDKTCFLIDTNEGQTGGLINYYPFDYYELITERVNCTNMYVCDNKKCIDKKKICDGHDDCGDRMDEKGCSPRDFGYRVRLTGSKNSNEGLIEVTAFGKTGYVCDDNFGLRDANVVCQELGFDMGAAEVKKNSFFVSSGSEETFYMMDDVGCLGNETSLLDCDFSGWGVHNCLGQEAVGVVCKTPTKTCAADYWKCDTGRECLPLAFVCDGLYDCSDNSDEGSQHCDAPTEIRLTNGTSQREGRIEIRHHGTWGTICDDDFNEDAAKVVCRQLGYKGAAVVKKDAYFGHGSGPIWLDQVFCSGNESSVEECTHWNWGEHNCDHGEDVGVICSNVNEYAEYIERHQRTREPAIPRRYPDRCGLRKDNIFNRNDDVHFRVIKGSIAPKGFYPWQAAIRIKGKTSTSHWCGAVIIHQKFVLTAAHCLVGYSKGAYIIVAGDYNTDEDEGTEQEAYIEDYFLHEDFKKGHKMNNDIALVKLKGSGFQLGDDVQAICLPDGDADYEGSLNCTISGFGSIESGRSAFSHNLRAGWVPLQKRQICTMPHVYGGALTEGMICAGSLDEGIDSCDGDSGGPLACLDRGVFTLFGITSWGQHCGYANKPGVYVKVAHYRKWIDDHFKKYSVGS